MIKFYLSIYLIQSTRYSLSEVAVEESSCLDTSFFKKKKEKIKKEPDKRFYLF